MGDVHPVAAREGVVVTGAPPDRGLGDELAGKRVAMRRDPAVGRSHDFGRACQQRSEVNVRHRRQVGRGSRGFFPSFVEHQHEDRGLDLFVERSTVGDELAATRDRERVEAGRATISGFEKAEGDAATLAGLRRDRERRRASDWFCAARRCQPAKPAAIASARVMTGRSVISGSEKLLALDQAARFSAIRSEKRSRTAPALRIEIGETVPREDQCAGRGDDAGLLDGGNARRPAFDVAQVGRHRGFEPSPLGGISLAREIGSSNYPVCDAVRRRRASVRAGTRRLRSPRGRPVEQRRTVRQCRSRCTRRRRAIEGRKSGGDSRDDCARSGSTASSRCRADCRQRRSARLLSIRVCVTERCSRRGAVPARLIVWPRNSLARCGPMTWAFISEVQKRSAEDDGDRSDYRFRVPRSAPCRWQSAWPSGRTGRRRCAGRSSAGRRRGPRILDRRGRFVPIRHGRVGVNGDTPLAQMAERIEDQVDREHRGRAVLAAREVEDDPCAAFDRVEDGGRQGEGRKAGDRRVRCR
ncbi:unnamed protein product [Acanthosepion pharaonis]|uniref:Uncharacterized protein n=1 Tax=Acanthosepion pharaonis TaxID=158019 RepID=A0A812E031_ACAPH|nr:unnamed protein product [Sepia pharaonis]